MLRAFFRLLAMVLFTITIIPTLLIVKFFSQPKGLWMARLWHRAMCKAVGISIEVRGDICTQSPVLYVANHISYLDIIALGSTLEGWFVAKKEVEGWPIFGALAKCQNTIFIERNPRKAGAQKQELANALSGSHNLILFPEGTSGDGHKVLPFKSTLFSVARLIDAEKTLYIQPITITYTRIDGIPIRRVHRPLFAWFGDMGLAPHLWQFLKQGKTTVTITAHPPVTRQQFANRKEMAAYCQQQVALGYSHSEIKPHSSPKL